MDPKTAPDFEADDINGSPMKLSDYRESKHVVLVFNRTLM